MGVDDVEFAVRIRQVVYVGDLEADASFPGGLLGSAERVGDRFDRGDLSGGHQVREVDRDGAGPAAHIEHR
jgi:hypothetical protein